MKITTNIEMDDSRDFTVQGLRGLKPLSQTNYIEWRDVIDDYLDSQNWVEYSKTGIPKEANEELRAKSAKIAVVLKTAAGTQKSYLLGLRTPKDILSKLEEINGGSNRGTISDLQRQFSTPDSKRKVDDVAASLSQLQARIGGISIEDRPTELSKKDALLRCYQEKYKTTIETLRIVAGDYSFAQIVERLRQAEFEAKDFSVETALKASNNTSKGSDKKENRKCYYCGKTGHIKPDCKKKKYDDNKKKSYGNTKPNAETAGIAWKVCGVTYIDEKDWCIDSGATSHMTSDRSIFVEYEDFKSTVGTAKNNISLNVIGRGKVVCPINGVNTIFEGVLHIPELSSNLLSPGKLSSAGLSVKLEPNKVVINRGKKTVATGPRVGDTWILRAYRNEETAFKAERVAREEALLWHRRLGHPGGEKLSLISQAVAGMPLLRRGDAPDCNTCNLTKSVRKQSQEEPANMATKPLERVFIDTWGPYKHRSLSGKRFMLVIVDEFSRMSWVYFMAHKSDVLDILPNWKKEVELESGKYLVKIRTDRAPELKKAVSSLKVIHETTMADTPEQNAKVERMNRTIVMKARSMLAGPGLPKRLWAEAMATACYLNNLTPSADKRKSPYELWTGNKPSVKHLKVYGCIAYVHIDKSHRDKLDLNAKKGIFIGYCRTNKQYRVLDLKTGSIIESSHVTFKENHKGGLILSGTDESLLYHPRDEISEEVFDQEESVLELPDVTKNLDSSEHSNTEPSRSDEIPTNFLEPSNIDHNIRPRRERKAPQRLIEELGRDANTKRLNEHSSSALLAQEKAVAMTPKTFIEAIKHRKWRLAIDETLESLVANKTWDFVQKPENVNLVTTKWVFKIKMLPNGQVDRYKARLVARGFTQRKGEDFFEVFSGVVRLETLKGK